MKTSFVFHRNHNIQIIGNETRSKARKKHLTRKKKSNPTTRVSRARKKEREKRFGFRLNATIFRLAPAFISAKMHIHRHGSPLCLTYVYTYI